MKLNYVIVGGGCFWGLEDLLRNLDGVTSTKVGYSGGDFENPRYADIRTGKTGHVEAVRVEYDEDKISLKEILHYFFKIHDPTTKNRQGNDVGTSYRSAVFYRDDAQKAIIENVIEEVNEIGRFENAVVTTVALEKEFYDAEEYHQNYLQKNPNGYSCHFERD
jgi:peptide-methionine (S)-S-oxide reductase